MRSFFTKSRSISALLLCAVVFGGFAIPHMAHASVLDDILSPLSAILVMIGGSIVGMAGMMLNFSVDIFIVQMGQLGNNSGVEYGWRMVRDLVNLTFVFGLLYVGFMTIIQGESANTRRWLIQIIIGALLVNFSLFFARVVIDISNVMASEIYSLAVNENSLGSGNTYTTGLSGAFMERIGLQGGLGEANYGEQEPGETPPFLQALLFTLLCLVAAFVFGAAAILIIIRFAILMFLMIISPVMFVATFLPIAGGWARKWWQTLVGQSLFAPAFMFTSFLAIKILNGLPSQTQNSNLIGSIAVDPVTGSIADAIESPMLLYFAMSMIMLVTGLIVARQMGAYGASTAVSLGNSLRKNAQGWVGKNTFGRGARLARKGYENLDEKMSRSTAGRFFRSAATVGTLGALSDRNIRGGLKKAEGAKYGGATSLVDDDNYNKEVTNTRARIKREGVQAKAVRAVANDNLSDRDLKAIQDMSLKELKELGAGKVETLAPYLTSDQIKKIKDSKDEFNEDEVGRITGANKQALQKEFKATADFGTMIQKRSMTEADVAKLVEMHDPSKDADKDAFRKLAPYITPGVWREMKNVRLKKVLQDSNYPFPGATQAVIHGWSNSPGGRTPQDQRSSVDVQSEVEARRRAA